MTNSLLRKIKMDLTHMQTHLPETK